MRDSDSQLIRSALAGDDDARREIVNRHADRLYGLAYSLVGNAADAEDMVQETMLAAFEQLGRFRGEASLKTWLSKILMRRAARHHRSERVRKTAPIRVMSDNARSPSGETRARSRDVSLHMDVMAALDQLSEDHRQVVVLREFQGMAYDEIAETLSVPRGTVESRLYRARQHLKELLNAYLP